MYFSDVYADRRIPQAMAEDEVLYGECLSGALYWNDFLSMSRKAGFGDPRRVTHRPLTIENPVLEEARRPAELPVGHLSSVQTARAGACLRRLRSGRDLQGHHPQRAPSVRTG